MRSFVFLSTCPDPWGGSEELWWEAACHLRELGHGVAAAKPRIEAPNPRIARLRELGCPVRDLNGRAPERAWRLASLIAPSAYELDHFRRQSAVAASLVLTARPDFVVISQGGNLDGLHLARLVRRLGLPYALIAQKTSEFDWPPDVARALYREAYRTARPSVFVSQHNRRLTEEQLGADLEHAVVVRNPVLAGRDGPLPPPPVADDGRVRLACVARLMVRDKAQDVLLRTLALPHWRERPLHVTFYGQGVNAQGLADLAARLKLERVEFAGQVDDVAGIWRRHDALVLPSRAEGLPLALVEALLCGRPAVVTDVAGNAEVVEDEVTGFVAGAPTVAALDEALGRAWARRADWPEMGGLAAERVRETMPDEPGGPLVRHVLAATGAAAAPSPFRRLMRRARA